MSTLVCSRELAAHLDGAQDLREIDALLPELAGIWMRGDPTPALRGAAALAGRDEALPAFASWASEHGALAIIGCGLPANAFPLDQLPPDLSIIAWPDAPQDLASVRLQVQDALLRAQSEQIERGRAIHERLTRVAVEGRGLDELARTLAELVDASAIIKDRHHANLAYANADARIDAVRRRALALGATTPDVIEALERDGTFERLRSERRPMHVKANPDLEMSPRVMAPVIMGDAYYGYISVARVGRVLERLDLIAVEHAATVATLILGREQAVRAHERSLRSVFVYESIFGHEPADLMEGRARYLGYDPADGYAVLVTRGASVERDATRETMEHVGMALDEAIASESGRAGLSTIVGVDMAVALIPAKQAGSPEAWRTRVERIMRSVFAANSPLELSAGVGRWYADRSSLRRSFAEARLALSIGSHVRGARSVTPYAQLGIYRLFADAVDRDALRAFRREQLEAIEDDPDLMKTLRAFLRTRGNKAQCAKELFVHLNTVKYRLQRIADITGHDLEDAQALLNLHVALEIGDVLPLLDAAGG